MKIWGGRGFTWSFWVCVEVCATASPVASATAPAAPVTRNCLRVNASRGSTVTLLFLEGTLVSEDRERVRGQPRTHFSMIRSLHLADLFTIANGFCGVGALFQAMTFIGTQERRHLYVAALLVPLAGFFDLMDGRVARWRHKASPMGREMESLADVISFGVAPAGIAFAAGLDSWVDQIILMYFVGCGLSRLARYNVTAEALASETGKIRYAHPDQHRPARPADVGLLPGRAVSRPMVRRRLPPHGAPLPVV